MKARSSAIASMDHNNEIVLKFLPRGASQRGKDFNWGGYDPQCPPWRRPCYPVTVQ